MGQRYPIFILYEQRAHISPADADEWKPERWVKPLPRTVEEANVPGIYANMYVVCFSTEGFY